MRQLTRKEWASSFVRNALCASTDNEILFSSLTDILVIAPTYLREILDAQGIAHTDTHILAEWRVQI